jgi:predicted nucleotidyltransferase
MQPEIATLAQCLSLTESDVHLVLQLLDEHVPGQPVWAFGSRTSGRARRRSDLDLAVGGAQDLPSGARLDLLDAFDESDLPIEVDVVDFYLAAPEFVARIRADFVAVRSVDTPPGPAEFKHGLRTVTVSSAPLEGAQ